MPGVACVQGFCRNRQKTLHTGSQSTYLI